jgi:hypothetical protein
VWAGLALSYVVPMLPPSFSILAVATSAYVLAVPVRLRLGPPSGVAELGFSGICLILAKLTQGPAVMIDRPPPPAAPKSDHT